MKMHHDKMQNDRIDIHTTTVCLYVSQTHGFNYGMPASLTQGVAVFVHIIKPLKNEVMWSCVLLSPGIFLNDHNSKCCHHVETNL